MSGSGSNLQEIAATSNGYKSSKSTGGVLESVDLSVLEAFILEKISSLIMPKSKDTHSTHLTCAAVFLDIENGLVTTEPALAFTTDKITVVSRGTLEIRCFCSVVKIPMFKPAQLCVLRVVAERPDKVCTLNFLTRSVGHAGLFGQHRSLDLRYDHCHYRHQKCIIFRIILPTRA